MKKTNIITAYFRRRKYYGYLLRTGRAYAPVIIRKADADNETAAQVQYKAIAPATYSKVTAVRVLAAYFGRDTGAYNCPVIK